jgi:hypothetical protein
LLTTFPIIAIPEVSRGRIDILSLLWNSAMAVEWLRTGMLAALGRRGAQRAISLHRRAHYC